MNKMTAEEVLRRYQDGERDFQRVNLRGQSFKGQNLSGADFSEADIRSTNFSNATLLGVNFTRATGGTQNRWYLVKQLLIVIIFTPVLLLYIASTVGIAVVSLLPNPIAKILLQIAGFFSLAVLAYITLLSIRQRVAKRIASGIAAFFAIVVSFLTGGAFIVVPTIITSGSGSIALPILIFIVGIFLIIGAEQLFNFDIGKFVLIHTVRINFGAMGGTNFARANLTGSIFRKAVLKNTNLENTTLTQVSWHDVKKLDTALLGSSILTNIKMRNLLVSLDGKSKDYQDIDFSEVNLESVNLEGANLKNANLSRSILRYANLKNANLREALCIETDFTGVNLTGACIQGWNIDHTTKLDNVDCQYVFLLEKENTFGSRERRPHDPDKVFAAGDFEQLYRKIITTVELLLRGGVNAQAFQVAFEQLITDNPKILRDSIQAIEKVGNDVKITVAVPESTDKSRIERSFDEVYTAKLEVVKAIALLESEKNHNNDLKEIHLNTVNGISHIFSNLTINANATNDSNNPNISAGANSFINTGTMDTSGTINLGTISGTVTNTISQLPDSNDGQGRSLKQLLTQLQQAIETDTALPAPDKADLLEQVNNLATAGQTEALAEKEGLTRKAKKMFEATLLSLPDTAKIVEASSKLLPIILKVLGVPV